MLATIVTESKGDPQNMDVSLRRVVGSLILLIGISLLTIGLYTGQVNTVLEIVKRILEASVAGAP